MRWAPRRPLKDGQVPCRSRSRGPRRQSSYSPSVRPVAAHTDWPCSGVRSALGPQPGRRAPGSARGSCRERAAPALLPSDSKGEGERTDRKLTQSDSSEAPWLRKRVEGGALEAGPRRGAGFPGLEFPREDPSTPRRGWSRLDVKYKLIQFKPLIWILSLPRTSGIVSFVARPICKRCCVNCVVSQEPNTCSEPALGAKA